MSEEVKYVTQEDLDLHPEFVEQGLAVGDVYPTDEDAAPAEEAEAAAEDAE